MPPGGKGRIRQVSSERKEPEADTGTEHPCVEWSEGVARYLIAISDLSRGEAKPTQAELARVLEVSQPSVLEMVRKLRGMGLVEEEGLALTSEGTSAALVLSSRRNAARDLTREVLGLDPDEAGLEAEHLASSASPALGRRLVAWRASRS